jgi:hypothetical protein
MIDKSNKCRYNEGILVDFLPYGNKNDIFTY